MKYKTVLTTVTFLFAVIQLSASETTIPEAVKKFTGNRQRMRIAVFDFANTAGGKTRFDEFIADTITTELSKYKITLLERKKLAILLKEHELSGSGLVDGEKAVKLGMLLPVDVIVSGSYTEMADRIIINGRFIHVGSGEILYAFTSSMKNVSEYTDTEKDACEPEWKKIRKGLSDLSTQNLIDHAVDIAIKTPFTDECGKIHYTVMYTFTRHKIFEKKYISFLIKALQSVDEPSATDEKVKSIFRFFASDGYIDNDEWEACLNSFRKMRAYALHIPLNYMLNSRKEDKNLVMKRADEIMRLTIDKKVGKPVPVSEVDMFFSVLGGMRIYNQDDDWELQAGFFKKYSSLIPDDDKYNKKAAGLLERMYLAEKNRKIQEQILNTIINFYKSRKASETLASETADLFRSIEIKADDRYEKDGNRIQYFTQDLKIINKALGDLYCMSVGNAKSSGYRSIIEDRTIYILKNGMKCEHTPVIKDLENDMRSRDWDKKIDAVELLSKIGNAAKEAEATVIKYLGQQGYGTKGGRLRRLCALTLGNIKTTNPKAIASLIELFPDYDNGVSYEAEEAIAKIGLTAMPYLIKGLSHKHHAVRLRSAKALGNLGKNAEKSLPKLKILAEKDDNPYVRKQATGAIQMINNDF